MAEARILQTDDADVILRFETLRLERIEPDENERQFRAWHASWRAESLAHYLPLGWSFGLFDDDRLLGYFLAQPQLFVRGMTQTLWIERIVAEPADLAADLLDLAYKLAREKHLQRVLLPRDVEGLGVSSRLPLLPIAENLMELKVTKFNG